MVVAVLSVALCVCVAGWWFSWLRFRRIKRWAITTAKAVAEGRPDSVKYRMTHSVSRDAAVRALSEMSDAIAVQLDELSQERDVLQHMLHAMTTGLVFVRDGGRIAMVNGAAQRMFRRPEAQWIGREQWAVFRDYDLCVAIDCALNAGDSWTGEVRMSDTTILSVRVIPIRTSVRLAAPLHISQGLIFDALVLCNDVSEWRRLERMRSEFVANVSHELKTPIAAIRGFAETLLEGDVESTLAQSFLKTIHNESMRMGRLVNDLLELSRLEVESGTMQFTAVLLKDVSDRAVQNLQSSAASRNIQVLTGLPEDVTVWADEDKLLQVFLNLLANAIQYMPEGGQVKIYCDVLIDQVKVHIHDNGIGIPDEHQARVFERFYRVDRDRSRASGGTGLGLAIVKHIVTAHGGQVGVSSEPGSGSDFWFTLSQLEPET